MKPRPHYIIPTPSCHVTVRGKRIFCPAPVDGGRGFVVQYCREGFPYKESAMTDKSILFTPTTLGRLTIPGRLVRSATELEKE